jgi:hypothetical protein
MKRFGRCLRAISPVLAVLMMIAVAIAGALVTYAWVMGYIGFQTEKSGSSIQIHSIANQGADLLVYVQNVGENVVQLDEDSCLYVNGVLVPCDITNVSVTQGTATLGLGDTAKLRYVGGAALSGEKVEVKVTTILGTSAENSAYPAGTVQSPIVFSRVYGKADFDEIASALVATSDGGYALAGKTGPFDSGTEDFWLVKTDAFGYVEWNQTYEGGTFGGYGYYLVETSDGGYALAGTKVGDFLLIKTDALGNEEWNKTYSGVHPCKLHSLIVTSDGGYAMAGETLTDASLDFLLVKIDASGNFEWNNTYGGNNSETVHSLIQTSDGGYALAGQTSPLFEPGDFWLVKTDANGNEEWNRTYGGTESDQAHSLVETSGGGYALAGITNSFGAGDRDFWLVKTNATGYMEWSQTYGGIKADDAKSLAKTSDGGYAIAGNSWSFGAGSYDFWLVKTDSSGRLEWSQTYGWVNTDGVNALVATSDGGYAMAGWTRFSTDGRPYFFLVKTDEDGTVPELPSN